MNRAAASGKAPAVACRYRRPLTYPRRRSMLEGNRDPGTNVVDLRYDTEQIILRDSAEKVLAERYDYRAFQKIADSEAGWSPELWAEFAALGWLGLPFAAEDG